MEQYKKTVDGQHAPEALIAKTLQQIHEEEKRTEQNAQTDGSIEIQVAEEGATSEIIEFVVKKKKSRRFLQLLPVAMVAGLALVVSSVSGADDLTYHEVDGTIIRDMSDMQVQQEPDVAEYEAYLGIEVTEVAADIAMTKAEVSVVYDETQTNILEDEGTFVYDVDGKRVVVEMSKSIEVAPEALMQVEPSAWNDMIVYAGENTAANQHMAATEQDGVRYFITGYDMSEKEFENFLKKFF